ncbi:MAG: DNA gyrase subunit B, partial [Pseudomonadota bacterium]
MPEIIEGGYLYIAQPPLYKMKRGQSELYLKNEQALEDYLVAGGLAGAQVIVGEDGAAIETYADDALAQIVEDARGFAAVLAAMPSRYPAQLIEIAALTGALDPTVYETRALAEEKAALIANRLDAMAGEFEKGWVGEIREGGVLALERELRGIKEVYKLDQGFFSTAEARRLNAQGAQLADLYSKPLTYAVGEARTAIFRPTQLVDTVLEAGRKGVSLQRYKGLGEMNPDQLWETTLDAERRTLLQVKISDVDGADDMFSRLMGDIVEPRRDFIQANALKVSNLDV